MGNVSTEITFKLKDLVSSSLGKLFNGINKITENAKKFGLEGQKSNNKVKMSIAELETKLSELKHKRYWEKDTEEVKKLNIQIQKTETEIKQLNNESENLSLGDKFGKIALNFNQISQSITSFAEGLSQINKSGESFEYTMAKVNTMAGLSKEEFEKLTNQVREVAGNISGINREDLGQGLYDVISQGVPKENWISFLEQSSKSSVGGIANLSEIVKVTSTMIKNYGLEWDKAGYIQDRIQKTVQLGSTTFEELAGALPSVTGNAATLGVKIDELLASFATLTGVSGNTSEVSTQMNAIFNAMVKPTSEAQKLAQSMGVAFDAAAIKKAGGMLPFLQQLTSKIEEYAQKTGQLPENIYATLFGSAESMKALLPLTGELADDFEEKMKQMVNATGTIEDAYKTMADTSVNKTQRLQNALDNLKDKIFGLTGGWMPLINVGTQQMVMFGQMLPAINMFGNLLGKGMSKIAPFVGQIVGRMLPALGAATTAQTGLNIAMLANPIGAIIAGVISFVAVIVLLVKNMNKITDWFKRQNKFMKGFIALSAKIFSTIFPIIKVLMILAFAIRKIIDNWGLIKQKVVEFVQKVRAMFIGIVAVVKYLGDKINKILQPIFGWFNRVFTSFRDDLVRMFESIGNFFEKVWERIKMNIQKLKIWFLDMKNKVVKIFVEMRDWILNMWEKLKSSNNFFIKALIAPFLLIEKTMNWLWERLKEFFAWLGRLAEKLGLQDVAKTFKLAYNDALNNKETKQAQNTIAQQNNKNTQGSKKDSKGNTNTIDGGGTTTIGEVARVFKITVNFDQNFTIKQESDYNKVKQLVEQTIISAIHDAEIIAG